MQKKKRGFEKSKTVSKIKLYKEDLIKLSEYLEKDLKDVHETDSCIRYEIKTQKYEYVFYSIKELLECKDIIDVNCEFSIRLSNIERSGLKLDLYEFNSSVYFSIKTDDNVLLSGLYSELLKFLKSKRTFFTLRTYKIPIVLILFILPLPLSLGATLTKDMTYLTRFALIIMSAIFLYLSHINFAGTKYNFNARLSILSKGKFNFKYIANNLKDILLFLAAIGVFILTLLSYFKR